MAIFLLVDYTCAPFSELQSKKNTMISSFLFIHFYFYFLPAPPGYDEHLYSLPGEGSVLNNRQKSNFHQLNGDLKKEGQPVVPQLTINSVDDKEPQYANEGTSISF